MDALSDTLVVVSIDVEQEWEAEFNRWHEEMGVPRLLESPGYLSAFRGIAVQGAPRYTSIFEVDSGAAVAYPIDSTSSFAPDTDPLAGRVQLDVAVYRQIFPDEGLVRGVAWQENTQPGAVLLNRFNVPADRDEEFNAWYNEEHLPLLAEVPGTISDRRFAAVQGSRKYLARYDLVDADVPSTDAWLKIRYTPWTMRVGRTIQDPWRVLLAPLGGIQFADGVQVRG